MSGEFRRATQWARKHVHVLMIAFGTVLLLYVAASYLSMYLAQRQLAAEWQRQNQNQSAPSAQTDDGLTRIVIPKIQLDAVIVEGTSYRKLKIAPGHMESTAVPGRPGNAVITAHRDTFFRHIYELTRGDEIQVRRNGQTFRYEVVGKKIVQPDDLSVVKQGDDARLTLITCYPIYYIGPAPERLVITSRLKVADATPAVAATLPATAGQ